MRNPLERGIQAGPRRSAGGPDVRVGLHGRGIVQVADPYDPELWPGIGPGEEVTAAGRTECTRDPVAAACPRHVLRQDTGNGQRRGGNQHVHRAIGRKMLAVPAPADAEREGLRVDREAHRATQTLSRSLRHGSALSVEGTAAPCARAGAVKAVSRGCARARSNRQSDASLSACRCTSLHTPSSRRKISVTRRSMGTPVSFPAMLTTDRWMPTQ